MPKQTKSHIPTPSQLLAEESSQPIFQLDTKEGKMRYANALFLDLIGLSSLEDLKAYPLYGYMNALKDSDRSLAEVLVDMLQDGEGAFRKIPVKVHHKSQSQATDATLHCWLTSENGEAFWQGIVKPASYQIAESPTPLAYHNQVRNSLNQIQRVISLRTGVQFFESMVKELQKHFQARYVFIAKILEEEGEEDMVQTISLASKNGLEQNISYPVKGSPCEKAMEKQGVCVFPKQVSNQFRSSHLTNLSIEGYAGITLRHNNGRILGFLVALFQSPITHRNVFIRNIMEVLSSRVVAEFDHLDPDVLNDSGEHVKNIMGNVPAVIYRCQADKDRRVTFVNQRIAPMIGYSPNEILDASEGLSEFIHPEDAPKMRLHLNKAYQKHEHYFFEYRLQHKEGSDVWVYDSGRFVEDPKEGWILEGILQDITSQKLTEKALIATESRYRSLISSMSEGIILHDLSGEVVACNQAAQDILSLSYEELTGRSPYNSSWQAVTEGGAPLSPENHPAMLTLSTGVPQHQFIMGVSRGDQTRIWLSVNTEVIRNNDNSISGVVATFSDITEIHQTKEQLQNSESRFHRLFEGIPYPIMIANQYGKIVMANPALGECFGYNPIQLIGSTTDVVISIDSKEEYSELIDTFFKKVKFQKRASFSLSKELFGVNSNEDTIPIEVMVSSLNIKQDIYALCMIRDMSQDKRYIELEKAHKKITDSLRYAQRIQMAQLGNHQEILSSFKDGVIFFSPKDIVSGDFYWYSYVQQMKFDERTMESETLTLKILIAADCTGHGVPGAFMAALGNAFLHEIVNEHHIIEPHRILSVLDQKIISTLQKRGGVRTEDGMDVSIMVLNEQTQELSFAGAKNPLYIIRDGEIKVIKGSPYSLGGTNPHSGKRSKKRFEKHTMPIQDGDRFYLSSDGFQDQFGGPEGRKYLTKNFRKLLLQLKDTPMNEQNEEFAAELIKWKGPDDDQTDDILVLGIEV